MTTDTTLFVSDPIINIDLSDTQTVDTYGTGFQVNAKGTGSTGAKGKLTYVKAGEALTQGQGVYLSTSVSTGLVTAALVTTTISASDVTSIGVVQKAIASGSYGWAWTGPFTNVEVLTTTGIAVGTPLTTHTVAGTISTGGDVILGLTCIETSVAGLTQCMATLPLKTN